MRVVDIAGNLALHSYEGEVALDRNEAHEG